MLSIRTILLTVAIVAMILSPAEAQEFITENGRVQFDSNTPLHSFDGTSGHLAGLINLETKLVDFFLDLETLETGNKRRDRDMRKMFEVDEFPFAEFTGTLQPGFDPNSAEKQDVVVEGTFTMHGVSRDIHIDGTLQKTEQGLEVEAFWTIDIRDYDMSPPGILFYRVNDEQEVRIEAILKPRTE